MRRHQGIIAVVIKQYGTGLYRTCVSLNRDNSVCLGTHESETSANDRLNLFWKAYDEGTIRHHDDLARLADHPVSPVPAAVATLSSQDAGQETSQSGSQMAGRRKSRPRSSVSGVETIPEEATGGRLPVPE